MKFCSNSPSISLSSTSCPRCPPAAHPNQIKIISAGHAHIQRTTTLPSGRRHFLCRFLFFLRQLQKHFHTRARFIYLFFIFAVKLILFPSLLITEKPRKTWKNKNKHITSSRYAQSKSSALKRCQKFIKREGDKVEKDTVESAPLYLCMWEKQLL